MSHISSRTRPSMPKDDLIEKEFLGPEKSRGEGALFLRGLAIMAGVIRSLNKTNFIYCDCLRGDNL